VALPIGSENNPKTLASCMVVACVRVRKERSIIPKSWSIVFEVTISRTPDSSLFTHLSLSITFCHFFLLPELVEAITCGALPQSECFSA
jgi:hypothetical protein